MPKIAVRYRLLAILGILILASFISVPVFSRTSVFALQGVQDPCATQSVISNGDGRTLAPTFMPFTQAPGGQPSPSSTVTTVNVNETPTPCGRQNLGNPSTRIPLVAPGGRTPLAANRPTPTPVSNAPKRPAKAQQAQAAVAQSFVVTRLDDTEIVCTPGNCTLRGAVTAANQTSDATITFDNALFVDGQPKLLNLQSDSTCRGERNLNLLSSMTIQGPGSKKLTIANVEDPQTHCKDRIFLIKSPGTTVSISQMTLKNGADSGAALHIVGVVSNLTDLVLTNNASSTGGAIFINGSTVTISNTTVSNNMANLYGGGIDIESGTVAILNSTISGNVVTPGYPFYGNCLGGGVYARSSTLLIANSTFVGNRVDNVLQIFGGGALCTDNFASATIINSTIAQNSAGLNNGGGIWSIHSSSSTLKNTIIAGNGSRNCVTSGGTIIDGGNNLQFGDATCGQSITLGDPKFALAGLGDNGGSTQTLALQTSSAAIDTGNPSVCVANPINNKDQRGFLRSVGTACDIGAFEFGAAAQTPTPTVALTPTLLPGQRSLFVACNNTQVNTNGGVNLRTGPGLSSPIKKDANNLPIIIPPYTPVVAGPDTQTTDSYVWVTVQYIDTAGMQQTGWIAEKNASNTLIFLVSSLAGCPTPTPSPTSTHTSTPTPTNTLLPGVTPTATPTPIIDGQLPPVNVFTQTTLVVKLS